MATDTCVGCLDSLECWVCLGRGSVEWRPGAPTPCVRCSGTGTCFVCQSIPAPIVLDLPRRAWVRRSGARDRQAAC